MSRLRARLFENYDAHYLRGNAAADSQVSAMYEQCLPDYEASYGHVIDTVGNGASVLDAGCGIGLLLYWLHNSRNGKYKLAGVDLSSAQLAFAKKNLPSEVPLHCGDAVEYLNQNTAKFAAIFGTDLLEHLADDDQMLNFVEAARGALIPGGIFVCRVPNMANLASLHLRYIDLTHRRGFTSLSLMQLLECARFKECRTVDANAADAGQWIRMTAERILHRIVYRVCGVGNERHFARTLIGIGRA